MFIHLLIVFWLFWQINSLIISIFILIRKQAQTNYFQSASTTANYRKHYFSTWSGFYVIVFAIREGHTCPTKGSVSAIATINSYSKCSLSLSLFKSRNNRQCPQYHFCASVLLSSWKLQRDACALLLLQCQQEGT